METVNDFRKSAGDRLDFQVIGPKAHELITIELRDSQGNIIITPHFGTHLILIIIL